MRSDDLKRPAGGDVQRESQEDTGGQDAISKSGGQIRKNLLLFVLSAAASILAVEVTLRLFWANPYAGSRPDTILKLRIHHGNIYQRFDRKQIDRENPEVSYRTNSRGYIEPALRFEDPDFTIAFLGGSTTECMAVDELRRFPFLVSKSLEDKGLRVNSLNAARSGGTLHDSINVLLNHVILDHPDAVILMHAANDIGVLKRDDDYSTRMGHSVSFGDICKYALQVSSSHSALFGLARKAATASHFERRDDSGYRTNHIDDIEPFQARLKAFVSISRAFGIVPVLMTQPIAGNIKNAITPEWMDANAQSIFNETIREIGKETGAEVIDLEAYILDSVKDEQELNRVFYDAMHVTDYGSSLYARYITEHLYRILACKR